MRAVAMIALVTLAPLAAAATLTGRVVDSTGAVHFHPVEKRSVRVGITTSF